MRRTIVRTAFWLAGVALACLVSGCGSSGSKPATGTGGMAGSAASSTGGGPGGSTAATGGSAGTGGAAGAVGSGAAGAAGGGGTAVCVTPDGGAGAAGLTLDGTATRPVLNASDAARYTTLQYLAQAGALGNLVTDDWDPTAGVGDVSKLSPNYTVAADGSGTHTTVQAAVTAAVTAGGSTGRVYIVVKPGTYREVVCVPKTAPPITLYGTGSDATAVTIVFDNYAGKAPDANANACSGASSTSYGTSGSATFAAFAAGFQAKNLTFSNDFVEMASGSNQAVALMTQGDQLVFENVRVLGNQDTLYVKSASTLTVARAYFKSCYVEGDVDFIFGRGTAVFDGCTLNDLTARQGTKGGNYLAPSTAPGNPYGFLVTGSMLTAATGTPANLVALGRAWDESVTCYMPGTSPNGQALVRDSALGAQIRLANPWSAAATTARAFSAQGNRLWEFHNSGPGAAGGQSADGGSSSDARASDGGADAAVK